MAEHRSDAADRGPLGRLPVNGLNLASILAFAIGGYALYNYWHPLVPLQERAIFAGMTAAALFLITKPQQPNAFWRYTDVAHAVLAAVAFGYIVLNWRAILMRQGAPTPLDMYLGAATVYLIVIGCIRNLGWGLTSVILAFLAYTFLGEFLPNWAGGHRGYSLQRIFTFLFLSENGVLGFAIDACLKYMLLFLLLGKVLERVGALTFIMDLSRAAFGQGVSGPPLIAVGSSALIGTMTGSSMSNVYVSGTITIPMMKKVGLKPEIAAAIEAAASNGSQILPPVMGFAVFFMVVLLQLSYFEIIVAAAIPGVLYFVSLFFSVWLRTRSLENASGLAATDEAPLPLREIFLSMGSLCFFATLGALVAMLAQRMAIQTSVLWAIALCIVLSWLGPNRLGPLSGLAAIRDSGRELVTVAMICLALGLITGPILLTGLGTKLPALLTEWSSGHLWLLLIGAFVASLIMGAGIPTSMAYVIVSLLVANAMADFGISKLAAHMFVFYAALAASITPPVALTSYVAANIAGADFWRTGWHAAFLGIPKYFVPFAFIYRPELLMQGTPLGIVFVVAVTTVGVLAMSLTYALWRGDLVSRAAGLLVGFAGFLLAVPPLSAPLVIVAVIGLIGGCGLFVLRNPERFTNFRIGAWPSGSKGQR